MECSIQWTLALVIVSAIIVDMPGLVVNDEGGQREMCTLSKCVSVDISQMLFHCQPF